MLVKHLLEAGHEAHKNITTYGPQPVHFYNADGQGGREMEIDGAIKLSDKYVAIVVGSQIYYWFEHVGVDEAGTMVLYAKGESTQSGGLDMLKTILFQ